MWPPAECWKGRAWRRRGFTYGQARQGKNSSLEIMQQELSIFVAVSITADCQRAVVSSGLGPDEARRAINAALDSGLLTRAARGRLRLTEGGHARLNRLLEAERTGLAQDQLPELYENFVCLDQEVKSIVTDWQLRRAASGPLDGGRSRQRSTESLVAVLEETHSRVLRLLNRAARQRPRLSSYARRLENALGAIRAGRKEFIAAPQVDSYHGIWFELHEDLLRTLGRDRTS